MLQCFHCLPCKHPMTKQQLAFCYNPISGIRSERRRMRLVSTRQLKHVGFIPPRTPDHHLFNTRDDCVQPPCDRFQYNASLSHLFPVGVSTRFNRAKRFITPRKQNSSRWRRYEEASASCCCSCVREILGVLEMSWILNLPLRRSSSLPRLIGSDRSDGRGHRSVCHRDSVGNSTFRCLWLLIRARDRLERERRGGSTVGGWEGVAPFDHQSGGGVGRGSLKSP